jgi:DNA modification methylase
MDGEVEITRSADAALESWILDYGRNGLPVPVDFRALSPFRSGEDRATHLFHPYPAKLLLNIPQFFLRCGLLAPPRARVLDPFCGSGTVLVEALMAGFSCEGADANPLARLITTAKTQRLDEQAVMQCLGIILRGLPAQASPPEGLINPSHWFPEQTIGQLSRLRRSIEQNAPAGLSAFFWTCFSAAVRRVSLADPRLSVPVRTNPDRLEKYGAKGDEVVRRFERLKTVNVFEVFEAVVRQNSRRASSLPANVQSDAVRIHADARTIIRPDAHFDLVLTSPPYVGAQKYVRASGLSLGWLGLTPGGSLKPHERQSIGREHLTKAEIQGQIEAAPDFARPSLEFIQEINPLRAAIAATYLNEMRSSLTEIARITRTGGHLVLVIGENIVAGNVFPTPKYLELLAHELGFETRAHLTDVIKSRGLMTKRNRNAGLIEQESIYIMRRVRST